MSHRAGREAGPLPLWLGADALLMQKLADRPDFSAPVIMDLAQAILEFARQDHDSLPGR